jgi:hypothetical protein
MAASGEVHTMTWVAHLARAAASYTKKHATRGGTRGSVRDTSKLTRSVVLPGEHDLALVPAFRPRLPEGERGKRGGESQRPVALFVPAPPFVRQIRGAVLGIHRAPSM